MPWAGIWVYSMDVRIFVSEKPGKHSGIKVGKYKFRFGTILATVWIDQSGKELGIAATS